MKKPQPPKKYTGRGYIQKEYKAPKELYDYIWSLTGNLRLKGTPEEREALRRNYHRFLAHLYVSMTAPSKNKDYDEPEKFVPIYSRLIAKNFGRNFSPHLLVDENIVEMEGHQTAQRKARGFGLVQQIVDKAEAIEYETSEREWDKILRNNRTAPNINLMTGNASNKPVKSELNSYKEGIRNTNRPKIINASINSLKPCPFNLKHIRVWVADLRKKYIKEKEKYEKIRERYGEKNPIYIKAKEEYAKARGRYKNDSNSLKIIRKQHPKLISKKSQAGYPLLEYRAAYKHQTGGRVTEIHGGFQSASQYFKHNFFRGMSGMVYNYDLKNSQANILLQELKACNKSRDLRPKLKTDWLEGYLNYPAEKNRIAKKLGIDVELWKTCLYAIMMGAQVKYKKGAVFKAIKEYYRDDIEKVKTLQSRVYNEVKDLTKVAQAWRNYIYETQNRRYHYQYREVKYWKTARYLHFTDYGVKKDEKGKPSLIGPNGDKTRSVDQCKRKLAAFILQARESYFIHKLTVICSKNGIPVYKNEHDGLITGKKIPKNLISKAAKIARLKDPVFVIKPLCPEEKRQEMRKYVKA